MSNITKILGFGTWNVVKVLFGQKVDSEKYVSNGFKRVFYIFILKVGYQETGSRR